MPTKNPRIPRKKGQPAKSKKHSDLYTDEDPKYRRFINANKKSSRKS